MEDVKQRGKVRALVQGLETRVKKTVLVKKKRDVRFAKGIESPMPSHCSHTTKPAVPKPCPSPSQTVPASLLLTSEEHAKGLQRLNDRLQEELVAAEIRAEAADRHRLDLELRLAEEVQKREQLEAQLGGSAGLEKRVSVSIDDEKAMHDIVQASIKTIADAQLDYLKTLVANNQL
mmetsp:Transcript_20578/g.66267  ORF Transcript_20578/g.66267 Transcript_20578/m.66267 type:complete len:176 (+) Transcript_20578:145-672(+)|eukprot:CAMPEP_0118913210 /NCGR_PEP_ID=MMETSP1166-20130328/14126_1 /TAXON_ID=1104430 /ORGANISM="Chrysoreinhardia sp, Strain CCMP3193" /LENGTH=175 /DNA_ID=CAMNT_0006852761 /DNA_START=62 /DNA_END=589 /DNA_ORIENTATION=-